MTDILKRLETDILLLDGAFGTELMARGIAAGEVSELWVLEKPDVIAEIHKNYFDAGADIVLTNTFGGTDMKLAAFDLGDKMEEINRNAAQIARSRCPEGKFVAGDIGPTGKLIKPYGDAEPDELVQAFARQAKALAEGGVDLFIIETMMDLTEALAAVSGVKEAGLPVFVSLTYDKKPRGYFTMMGNKPADAARALVEAGADGVGTNCTLRIGDMVDLVAEIRDAVSVPVFVEPNAGSPELVDGKAKYVDGPEEFAAVVPNLVKAGANIVGGCCGTTPQTIAAVRKVLDSL
jgi:5-methyltetrahydrofolate--homocysteine methyltransferase